MRSKGPSMQPVRTKQGHGCQYAFLKNSEENYARAHDLPHGSACPRTAYGCPYLGTECQGRSLNMAAHASGRSLLITFPIWMSREAELLMRKKDLPLIHNSLDRKRPQTQEREWKSLYSISGIKKDMTSIGGCSVKVIPSNGSMAVHRKGSGVLSNSESRIGWIQTQKH